MVGVVVKVGVSEDVYAMVGIMLFSDYRRSDNQWSDKRRGAFQFEKKYFTLWSVTQCTEKARTASGYTAGLRFTKLRQHSFHI